MLVAHATLVGKRRAVARSMSRTWATVSEVFAESYGVARHARMMLVAGRLERQGTVIHVLAEKLSRLQLPGGEEPNVRSRDFH